MNKRARKSAVGSVVGAICVWLFAAAGEGAIYYVNKAASNASDSNAGSISAPWKTIQKAIDVAAAGDTVYVRAGVYQQALTLKRSGSAGKYITFRAFTNEAAVIDGTGSTTSKFINWKGAPSGGTDKNYIMFDGFEVRNCYRWGFWIEGDYNAIINCKVHDNGETTGSEGILVREGDYNIISSNDVYNSGWNGISVENSNYATISFNRSHDNAAHFGINVFPNTSEAQVMETGNNIICNVLYKNKGGIYSRYQQDNIIAGNVMYGNNENGIFLHYHSSGPSTYTARTKIYNNTIVGNGTHGIWDANATYLTIKNNILMNQATTDKYYEIYVGSGVKTGHAIDYNLYYPNVSQLINWGGTRYSLSGMRSSLGFETHGVAVDPKFKNLSGNDYTLLTNSPAIDVGANVASEGVAVDLTGLIRPQGTAFDMGAYEAAGAAPSVSVPPAPPTGLHLEP